MTRGPEDTDGAAGLGGHDPRELLRGALEGEADDPAEESRLRAELERLLPDLELLERLGRGGMGIVWRARQKSLSRTVALKVLAPRGEAPPDLAERFEREARALARLVHPGIVAVHAYGREGELCWLVMECVEGPTLRELLAGGPLEPARALALAGELCAALQYAHARGVVHRDVKPENVLIDAEGHAKIADFGLAKLLGEPAALVSLTASQQVLGTLRYMAPEQLDRPLEVDHRADLYALGVVLYEMLTGEVPMGRFDLPSARLATPVHLDRVIERSLQREPARRYQQASEVESDVADARAHLQRTPSATPASPGTWLALLLWVARWATLALPLVLWGTLLVGATSQFAQRRVEQAERDSEVLSVPMKYFGWLGSSVAEALPFVAGTLAPLALYASLASFVVGWIGIAIRSRHPVLQTRLRTLTQAASQFPWTLVCALPIVLLLETRSSVSVSSLGGFLLLAIWTPSWLAWAEGLRLWLLRPGRTIAADRPEGRGVEPNTSAGRRDLVRPAALPVGAGFIEVFAHRIPRWIRVCSLPLPVALLAVVLVSGWNHAAKARLPRLEDGSVELSTHQTLAQDVLRNFPVFGLPFLALAFLFAMFAMGLGISWILRREQDRSLQAQDAHLGTICRGACQLPWSIACLTLLLPATATLSDEHGAGFLLLLADLAVWMVGWLAIAGGLRRWLVRRWSAKT